MLGLRRFVQPHRLEPGDYSQYAGVWYASTPDGRLANLASHQVDVHDNGTISVQPSILVNGGPKPGAWHGYLTRGVWRAV